MVSDDILKAQLSKTLDRTSFPSLGEKYEGKVRDCYIRDGKRIIVVTDRISAFDVVLGTIPFKGQVLNQIAAHWFELARGVAPNHVLTVPDPVVTVGVECKLLPVEWVMRSYLTGVTSTSIWRHYEQGSRMFCGHALPEGMRKNQPLPKALLTPSTKADKGGHDESVSREEILQRGLLGPDEFAEAAAMCARLFAFGQAEARKRGLILVDTKYEIGRRPDGTLCFIDEIHTPDSSRYWYADDYEARIARGDGPPPTLTDDVRCEAARRYIAVYELITGKPFAPDTEEPIARLRRHLRA